MYKDEDGFVRRQNIKIVLVIVIYIAVVLTTGRWLP